VDRDQPCGGSANGLPACSEISQSKLDFTKIFLGGGGNGPGPSPSTSPSHSQSPSPSSTGGSGGSCFAAWNVNTSYVPNDNVSYNGENYTSLYWSTGVTPGSAIAWNIWKPVGAC
jgi:chitinase